MLSGYPVQVILVHITLRCRVTSRSAARKRCARACTSYPPPLPPFGMPKAMLLTSTLYSLRYSTTGMLPTSMLTAFPCAVHPHRILYTLHLALYALYSIVYSFLLDTLYRFPAAAHPNCRVPRAETAASRGYRRAAQAARSDARALAQEAVRPSAERGLLPATY